MKLYSLYLNNMHCIYILSFTTVLELSRHCLFSSSEAVKDSIGLSLANHNSNYLKFSARMNRRQNLYEV